MVDKTYVQVKTKQAKVEQRETKAMELIKRDLLKAARFECAAEIAKDIQNILKALDIAKRAMLTLKKAEIHNQRKVIAE